MDRVRLQKQLIVNADDLGLDPCINAGIIESFSRGVTTSVSVLACGRAFDEAAGLLSKNKGLSAGVHVALNEERPLSSPDEVRSLIDEKNGSFAALPVFLKRLASGRIVLKEVYLEFATQIERFMAAGLRPVHIDSHKHIHHIPKILDILLELSKRFGIRRIRISRSAGINIPGFRKGVRAMEMLGLSTLAGFQSGKIKGSGMDAVDHCYGLMESGCLNEVRLAGILNRLPAGRNELICHPGITTEELSSRYNWGYDWSGELKALTSPAIKELVKKQNIQLIPYEYI